MKIIGVSFCLQKDGNFRKDYEDAFSYSLSDGVAAIADGAAATCYSRKWAKILAQSFKHNPELWLNLENLEEPLEKARKAWLKNIDFSKFSWYIEKKIREGACSTLLGFKLYEKKSETGQTLTWKAVAIGDSCLFHIRDGNLLTIFPVKESKQFTNCLPLLCSVKDSPFQKPEVKLLEGLENCQPGDCFMFCTDALSKYILADIEARQDSWRELITLQTYKEWVSRIQQYRVEGKIDNDDTTMIAFYVS